MRSLKRGSTIGVVCISSSMEPERFQPCVNALETMDFQVLCPLDPTKNFGVYTHGFGCAPAEERAKAFMQLVEDESVDVILLARGGYGAQQVLPLLDFSKIAKSSKLVVGYSDVTALHAAIAVETGRFSIHGPTLSKFHNLSANTEARVSAEALVQMLMDPDYRITMQGRELRSGTCHGRLIVGNLTMLLSLIGTQWDLDYSGAVLVIEDVNEPTYKIHRGLLQMKYAGKLQELAGLCFGQFTGDNQNGGPSVEDLISNSVNDILSGTKYPVIYNVPVGHSDLNMPLPWSCLAKIENGELQTLESPLE